MFITICTLWRGAGGSFFWEHGGKRKKEKGSFSCGMGERTPHTHDMNMDGRERTWRERRKERKNNGEQRKGKEICQDFLVFSQAGVRQVHVCVCVSVFQESKSRYIKGIEGIGWHYRTASSSSEWVMSSTLNRPKCSGFLGSIDSVRSSYRT